MNTIENIRLYLETAFSPSSLEIEDESWKHTRHVGAKESGGGHYIVHITSAAFSEKSRIEQHRMVNDVLAPLFKSDIHALSIRAKAI